jgi:hypothetical protein
MDRKEELRLIWKHTHRDFKGKINGVKHVLCLIPGSGTCSVPLDALPPEKHAESLKYALWAEERAKHKY